MAARVVVLSDTDEEAASALADLQVRKDRTVFASRAILVGERLGIALRENEEIVEAVDPPVYYKLRDGRHVWHGLHKALPNAIGQGIYTARQGAGYSGVEVERDVPNITNKEFTAFLDPMLSRGTTATSVCQQVLGTQHVGRFASLHCFAAEEGISNLQTKLTDFCEDYLLLAGMRGFHVDASGYMGAIRREMDWGDVQDGTYFLEYPPDKEIEVVLGELATSGGLDIVMASILLLLRAHEQHRHAVHPRDPALPTDGWIHTMMCLMKQERYPILVASGDWDYIRFYPRSQTISYALERLVKEDLVRRLTDESYPTYVTSQWGRVYLDRVYTPVLSRQSGGLYYQLVDAIQVRVEQSIAAPFGSLVHRAISGRKLLQPR